MKSTNYPAGLSDRQFNRLIDATANRFPNLHGAALVNKVIATVSKSSKKPRLADELTKMRGVHVRQVMRVPRFSALSEVQRLRVAKLWCNGYTSFEIAGKLGVRGNEKDDPTKPTRGIINQLRSHGYMRLAATTLRKQGRRPVRSN